MFELQTSLELNVGQLFCRNNNKGISLLTSLETIEYPYSYSRRGQNRLLVNKLSPRGDCP